MATFLRVLIGVIGSILGAVLGSAVGLLFAGLVGLWSKSMNPSDPSAGAISVIGIATMPLGCMIGLVGGPFLANWLVPAWSTKSRASANEISGSVAACAVILLMVILLTPVKDLVFGYAVVDYVDVEFQIQVTELESRKPVSKATVQASNLIVRDANSSQPLRETLITDDQGHAVYVVRNCPYSTSRGLFAGTSPLRLVGRWEFTAEAAGYAPAAFRSFHAPNLKSVQSPVKVDVDLFLEQHK